MKKLVMVALVFAGLSAHAQPQAEAIGNALRNEKVAAAISSGKTAWLIEASDGAADGRRKLWAQARKQPRPPGLFGVFTAQELGLALGLENVIHTAFLAGRAADRWAQDACRLSGFCPLLPESWREEP